jgi:serine/threonine-protein kinase
LSAVRSKHVVELYDVVWDGTGKVAAMIMEYIDGQPLSAFHQQPYDQQLYLRTIYQIARGLADIHDKNLVHRDVKLDNMKTSKEGVVKLFDFGLTTEHGKHVTTASMGTQVYRAPEMYSPPITVNREVDTYAFGVCCWTLLKPMNQVPKVLGEIPPQHSSAVPSIGTAAPLEAGLCAVLDGCLSVSPVDRPEMKTIAAALEAELLRGQHTALLIYQGKAIELNAMNKQAKLDRKNVASAVVRYDGLKFVLASPKGAIYVNNVKATSDVELRGACVITLGGDELGAYRDFIEFDISHPEVVL